MDFNGFKNLQRFLLLIKSLPLTPTAYSSIINTDGGGNPYHDPKTGRFTFADGSTVSPEGRNTKCTGFRNKASEEHHKKHLRNGEFGNITFEEYVQRGIEFLSQPCGGNIDGYATEDGEICRFDVETGEYAKGIPGKELITYFKAKFSNGKVDIVKANNYFNALKKEEMIE